MVRFYYWGRDLEESSFGDRQIALFSYFVDGEYSKIILHWRFHTRWNQYLKLASKKYLSLIESNWDEEALAVLASVNILTSLSPPPPSMFQWPVTTHVSYWRAEAHTWWIQSSCLPTTSRLWSSNGSTTSHATGGVFSLRWVDSTQ